MLIQVEKNPDPAGQTPARLPGLAGASFAIPLARGAGGDIDRGALSHDSMMIAGKTAPTARLVAPVGAKPFVSVHAAVLTTPELMVMAAVITRGDIGQVNENSAYLHDIQKAYATLQTLRLKPPR